VVNFDRFSVREHKFRQPSQYFRFSCTLSVSHPRQMRNSAGVGFPAAFPLSGNTFPEPGIPAHCHISQSRQVYRTCFFGRWPAIQMALTGW
jgi:hypothetical protein